MKQYEEKPTEIYCKLEDVTVDADGNIHFFIKKDKIESAERTAGKLRKMIGKDFTIQLIPFYRKNDQLEEVKELPAMPIVI
jgi:hypothetical protein